MSRIGNLLDINEAGWIDKVNNKWDGPDGLYELPAAKIAGVLADSHNDLKSAMASVSFFFNRWGSDAPSSSKKKRIDIEKALQKKFK